METENKSKKIVLSDELQNSIMKFFLKTSIPRKARQEREKLKTIPETKEQGDK